MLGLKSLKSSTRSSILTLLALAPGMLGQTPDVPTKSGAHVETDGIPRLPNGRPDLNGIWDHPYVPDVARSTKNGVMSQEGPGSLPYLPAALEEFKKYDPSVDGDYTGSCLPFGYFRSFNAPYPIQILQTQEYVGFLFEQNNWFHTVTMGKKHPDPDTVNFEGQEAMGSSNEQSHDGGEAATAGNTVDRPLGQQAQPTANQPVITIHNDTELAVTIKARKWVVTNAGGEVMALEGEGVVGQMPVIDPGGTFEYNSYHLLDTTSAMAEGSYLGLDALGRRVITRIPKFEMRVPGNGAAGTRNKQS